MNTGFYQGKYLMRGMITPSVLLALSLWALPAVAPPTDKPTDKPRATEAERTDKPPYTAGRHKSEPAQEKPSEDAKRAMELAALDCGSCHSCNAPTKDSPCLRLCPRSVAETIADAAHEVLPDDIIMLNAFDWEERNFMPTAFTHKLHADMAGMAGGCGICHHHTAKGKLHPPCKECHKPTYAASSVEDMRMPSLKGAYHRQCMGCHRDWAHNTKCSVCHLPKGDQDEPIDVDKLLAKGDVAGTHPPIESPEHIFHETDYEPGPNVMFRHRDHVNEYGYECERCHRDEGCERCHERLQKPKERLEVVGRETHGACFACHEEDRCERCHSTDKDPKPQRFDHSLTGFPLGKYHDKLTCRACHKRLFFLRKLQGDCAFCHKNWDPDTFEHGITGQVLDENHTDIDCGDCHKDAKFVDPPSCDECHDEDISFPARRPGPVSARGAHKTE